MCFGTANFPPLPDLFFACPNSLYDFYGDTTETLIDTVIARCDATWRSRKCWKWAIPGRFAAFMPARVLAMTAFD